MANNIQGSTKVTLPKENFIAGKPETQWFCELIVIYTQYTHKTLHRPVYFIRANTINLSKSILFY